MPEEKKKPAKGQALSDVLERWRILFDNLDINNYPEIAVEYAAVGMAIDDVEDSEVEQEGFKEAKATGAANIRAAKKAGNKHWKNLRDFVRIMFQDTPTKYKKYVPADQYEVDKTKYGWSDEVAGESENPQLGWSIGDIIMRWTIMLGALAPDINSQPFNHMEDDFDALTVLLASLKQFDSEIQLAKGNLKIKTTEQKELVFGGERNYRSIRRYLKWKLGFDSPELTLYFPTDKGEVDKTKKGYGKKPGGGQQPAQPV